MDNTLNELWEQALGLIENEMTNVGFNTWIKPLRPVSYTENSILLATDTDIIKSMVSGRYSDLIKNTLFVLTNREYVINITIGNDNDFSPEEESKKDDSPSSKYTFDNFIVGGSNRFAHAAALAVAESPASAYNPLFIYGGVGLGKTHLMHAIKNYILTNNKNAKIAFVSSETFTNELINSFKNRKNEEFRAKYRSMDVLLVDDIQFIAGKTATEEEFFHTFNALKDANKQIVLTSDRPPSEIKTLEERLRSRFEGGLTCDVAPPDVEMRIAILRQKAQEEKVVIDDAILCFIAEKVTSNIRELEGIFNKVVAYKGLVQEDITIESVMKILKDYSSDGKSILNAQYIVECCARFYSMKPESFYSTSQKKDVSFARQVSFYICKEILDISLQKIGEVFSRDHTTVLYGIKKVETKIKTDAEFRNSIDMLIKDIKSVND